MREIKLRRAELRDSADILRWRNDPDTINASFDSKQIDPSEHERWFTEALKDPMRILFIAETMNGEKIGMLRFDLINEKFAEVNINLSPEMRGKGYGSEMIRSGAQLIQGKNLIARAKGSNPASVKVFERSGYVKLFKYVDVDNVLVYVMGASAQ